jgi:molybdenum cofactor cytidylyltransferase
MSRKKIEDIERGNNVWILVLAAGYSRRMGMQKLLLPINGETLIRFLVTRLLGTSADGIVLVTNSEYREVKLEVNDMPVVVLENEQSHMGMSSSLRIGIQYLINRKVGAALIVLADQPLINLQIINLMIKLYRLKKYQIIQPSYRAKPSHPVLFSYQWFFEILKLHGDQGARNILKKKQEKVTRLKVDLEEPRDIDEVSDYVEFLQWVKGNESM